MVNLVNWKDTECNCLLPAMPCRGGDLGGTVLSKLLVDRGGDGAAYVLQNFICIS